MASRRHADTLEFRLDLGHRKQALLGRLFLSRSVIASQDNFVFIDVIFVEEGLFVMYRAGSNFHLQCMLLSILLDLLQMLVITIFRKPGNDISVGPIYLKRVSMLVIDVVLAEKSVDRRRTASTRIHTSMGIWST